MTGNLCCLVLLKICEFLCYFDHLLNDHKHSGDLDLIDCYFYSPESQQQLPHGAS